MSELYYPEDVSTGYFVTCLGEGLAPFYDVRVLCSQPTYQAKGQRAPATEVRKGVRIRRCPATTLAKDSLPLRVINAVTISASIFLNALFRISAEDVVIVVTNPPLLPYVVAAACRLRGARCLLLVHDVYPEILVRTGLMSSDGWPAAMLAWCSARLYRTVDRVIVIGRDMRRLFVAKLGAKRDRVVLIPNFGDPDQISPKPREENAVLRSLGVAERFVVQYSGNMGRTHGLEFVLEAARALRGSNVQFLFVGAGAKRSWIEAICQREAIDNVAVLGYVARQELGNYLTACDVALVSLQPGMAGISVPSRMYNILAAGKPIIAVMDDDSELACLVQHELIGWVVPPGRPEAIVAAIEDAQRSQEQLDLMSVRARQVAQRYTVNHAVAEYRAMIEAVRAEALAARDVSLADKPNS